MLEYGSFLIFRYRLCIIVCATLWLLVLVTLVLFLVIYLDIMIYFKLGEDHLLLMCFYAVSRLDSQ